MPHYKSGKEAKVGDVVQALDYGSSEYVGVVSKIHVGTGTCDIELICPLRVVRGDDGQVLFAAPLPYQVSANAKDSEKIA